MKKANAFFRKWDKLLDNTDVSNFELNKYSIFFIEYIRGRLSGNNENFNRQILAIQANLILRRTTNPCNFIIFSFLWKNFSLKFWWQLLGQVSKFLPIQNFPTVFRPFCVNNWSLHSRVEFSKVAIQLECGFFNTRCLSSWK